MVPIGRMPASREMVLSTRSLATSTTVNDAPVSEGTYALEPSGRNAMDLGRGPTFTDLGVWRVLRSITNTAPSCSDVTQTRPLDGSTDTPSGSAPILYVSTILPLSTSTMLACAASSLAT